MSICNVITMALFFVTDRQSSFKFSFMSKYAAFFMTYESLRPKMYIHIQMHRHDL